MSNYQESAAVRNIRNHQFISMIVISIGISLFLVYVALSLYQSSGTIQLDLSRPGYADARKEASKDNRVFESFSADGPVNAKVLAEFDALYDSSVKDATTIEAFSGAALGDKALSLESSK